MYSFTDELGVKDKKTHKYISSKNEKFVEVRAKEGILKFKKGNFHGITESLKMSEAIIKPIKFIYNHMLQKYAVTIGWFVVIY